ncbi:MAG: acyl-CoA desaturase [Brumimicrobium sp.]|nr:acyl-CoA desaturase [Brumimicrobium sp.]
MAQKISFSNDIHTNFSNELIERVNAYFKLNNKKKSGDWRLFHKSIVLMCALIAIYFTLIFGTLPTWVNIILCVVLGFVFAFIGFNMMHDGGHDCYSNKKWLNSIMGYSLNLMGGSTYYWKIKHNIIHHTFTNIEGFDDDIDIKPFIRTNHEQKRYFFHKFQHVYALILYSITYLFWVAYNDFTKYFTGKIAQKKVAKMKLKNHIGFWATKLVYVTLFILIPLYMVGWKHALVGYFIMAGVTGIVISVIFQLAHVVEEVNFPIPETDSLKIKENWFVHQLQTTANLATKNKVLSWMIGGLNFQVEHHLFPRISHIHYPEINKIVKEVCVKYDISYHEYANFKGAFFSHLKHLKAIGAKA